jgi:hypothetical protein
MFVLETVQPLQTQITATIKSTAAYFAHRINLVLVWRLLVFLLTLRMLLASLGAQHHQLVCELHRVGKVLLLRRMS